jgi:hypothetical protein
MLRQVPPACSLGAPVRKLLATALIGLTLAGCSAYEFSYVAGLAGAIIDYKLHDSGVR